MLPVAVTLTKPGTASWRVSGRNLNRARILLEFYDNDTRGRSGATAAASELLRSAVVFAVGALDAYLHDLILEIIPRHTSTPSPAMQDGLREIAKKDPSLAPPCRTCR